MLGATGCAQVQAAPVLPPRTWMQIFDSFLPVLKAHPDRLEPLYWHLLQQPLAAGEQR